MKYRTGMALVAAMALVGTVWAGADSTNQPSAQLRLDLDLVDGSRIIGVPDIESVPVQTPYAKMDIPLGQISAIAIGEDHETAAFDLRNGDKLKGVIALEPIMLETVFGRVSVGIEHIRALRVVMASASGSDGLMLHYTFDADTEGQAVDQSGHRNHGQVTAGVRYTDGVRGRAIETSSRTTHVRSNSPRLDMNGWRQLTVVLAFRLDQYTTYGRIINRGLDNEGNGSFGISLGGVYGGRPYDGVVGVRVGEGEVISLPVARFAELGTWYRIAMVYDGKTLLFYVNGNLHTSRTVPGNLVNLPLSEATGCDLFIGSCSTRRAWLDTHIAGAIDEVMIFRRALPLEEIRALQGLDPDESAARALLPDARLGLGPSWPADLAEQARRIDQLSKAEKTVLLRQVMTRIPDPDKVAQFLLARLAAGNPDEAVAILSEALSTGNADLAQRLTVVIKPPMNDGQAAMLAWSWMLKGQPKEALTALAQCGSEAREVSNMRAQIIGKGLESLQADWKARRYEKLLAAAAGLAAAVNDDARFLYMQALALAALDRQPEADALVKKALALNPANEAAHYTAGDMLMKLGQDKLAEGEWRRILEIPPDGKVYDLNAHLRLGQIMSRRKDYAGAAKHYGTVLQTYRDGTADGCLVGMKVDDLEKMVRDLEARAAGQAADGVKKSGRQLNVEITATLKNARAADLRQALAAAVTQMQMNIEPAGMKISDMKEIFVLQYDPERKEAGFFLHGSSCSKPVRLAFEEETVSVAVTQLDSIYFYNVSRRGGQAELAAIFAFDYEVTVVADEALRDYTSEGLKVGDKTFTWKALQEGIQLDWLPGQLVIELEGVSPSGAEEQLRYTLPALIDLSAWAASQDDEEQKP